MEKKEVPTTVVMNYDDAQSTYSIEQPPPAYKKPESSSVKIAKLVAATILALSFILGAVVLGAVYIQTKNQCIIIPQAVPFEPLPAESAPVAEALHQSPTESKEEIQLLDSDRLHIPLQLDIDDLTGQMMENNQRARVNCLIEKKKAEEIVTQTPKHLRTPFGNLTTDHRYMHVTGETMSLSCRSGNARSVRPVQMDDDIPALAAAVIQVHPQQMQAQSRMQGGPPHQQQMPPQHPQQQQHHQQHPVLGHPLMMGPGGPMPPPPHPFMMNAPRDMREPHVEHFRAKRRVKQCACACDC